MQINLCKLKFATLFAKMARLKAARLEVQLCVLVGIYQTGGSTLSSNVS